MDLYTEEIGVTTGFGAGPTIRDMYRVLSKLCTDKTMEVTRVRIGAIHPNKGMRLSRAFTHIRELEDYARGTEQDYIPLDGQGIERELASGEFDFLASSLRRLSRDERSGSYVLFHAHSLNGEISYHREVSRARKLRGLREIIAAATVGIAASAYGWVMADQAVVRDASQVMPYMMIGTGVVVGGAFVADGVRRFVRSERRYFHLQLQLLKNDDEAHERARALISAVKNNAGPEGHS